jgi:uncharacterized repeat protein (TIGR02543 family)
MVIFSLFTLHFSLFIFSACQNPLSVPKTENIPAGKGSFSITVNVARTILPTLDESKFVRYTLDFKPSSGSMVREERNPADLVDPVYLEPGTYSLVVTAYFDTGKTKLAARGSLDNVMISEGQSVAGTVTLKAIIDSGTGTFIYTVIFPDVETAKMNITSLKAGSQGQDHSLSSGSTETLNLNSGYYNVVFTLKKNNDDTLIWRELLHIYAGLESSFGMEFYDTDFYLTKYTVTFVFDNGDEDGKDSVIHGDKASRPPNPTKDNYTFGGWYSDEDLTTVYDFDTLVYNDFTLYAVWNPLHTVTFNGNENTSGTVPAAIQQTTFGSSITLPGNTGNLAKTGYAFGGWSTSAGGTALTGTTYTPTANIELYAVWNGNAYTVIYDANNGDGTMANSAFTYSIPQNLRANAFTRNGYTFAGWATTSTGTVAYTDGQSVSNLTNIAGATVTLYAIWKTNTYNINYQDVGNGPFTGIHTNPPTTHTYGTTTNLTTPTKTGFIFSGWFTAPNGSGTALTTLAATGYTADITLYVGWTSGNATAGLSYTLNADGTAYVVRGRTLDGAINIPALYRGLPVTTIDAYGFQNLSITSVTIPNSVTSINGSAFSNCTELTSITIPSSVTSINSAFTGCTGLTSITVDTENTVFRSETNCIIRTAYNELVVGCRNSTIPGNVTIIGYSAFSDLSVLTSITIPISVSEIVEYAFYGTGLSSITIPNSVNRIGVKAFGNCDDLKTVIFVGRTLTDSSFIISDNSFPGVEGDGSLKNVFSGNGTYTRAANGIWTKSP